MSWTRNVKYYGAVEDLPLLRELCAGPLSLVLEDGDLRYVRLGKNEVIRRIYVAVRIRDWLTVPPRYSNLVIQQDARSFLVEFDADHVQGEVDFHWHGRITGSEDGTICYAMDGEVQSSFWRNRIGFCVLHPMAAAGAPVRVEDAAGSVQAGFFPTQIAPQLIQDGLTRPVQPFEDMRCLTHEVRDGVWATVEFRGDLFELEDQRNWTDASFKTYSTPLKLPFPVQVAAGEKISQTVTLSLDGAGLEDEKTSSGIGISYDVLAAQPLPRIGLGAASHGHRLADRECERLRKLSPAHIRFDLELSAPDMEARLETASAEARALGTMLEAALFLSDDAEGELERFVTALDRVKPDIARWLVFHKDEPVTSARWLGLARSCLARFDATVPIYGGTNIFFMHLNRANPPFELMDGVAYSANPQEHAFDVRSLAECPPVIGVTIASARAFCENKPLAISPITLRRRFNPNVVGPQPPTPHGELPANVDPRQMSLFGAVWTLGAIKAIAEAGLESATFYETTGWRGVMETEDGSPLPEKFYSEPNMVFPLYHILADVIEMQDAKVLKSVSSRPLHVETLVLRAGARSRWLAGNLTDERQEIQLVGISAQEASLVRLNEHTFDAATMQPEEFRVQEGERISVSNGELRVSLLPFETIRVDWTDN